MGCVVIVFPRLVCEPPSVVPGSSVAKSLTSHALLLFVHLYQPARDARVTSSRPAWGGVGGSGRDRMVDGLVWERRMVSGSG